jgi:16S rRNA (uracil1498-N3)-methyltransferase
MALPFFFVEETATTGSIILSEETSKHIVQVLRMQQGEQLQLTNGKGNLLTCKIIDNNRKKCVVEITKSTFSEANTSPVCIGISLVKNNTRFEWFLEKATEIGVSAIIPLICERTEKQFFKQERMKSILVSAMLQSQQVWLPVLNEPQKIKPFIVNNQFHTKYIAHCESEDNKVQLTHQPASSNKGKLILIGPEGDFTKEEITLALQHQFVPVALGNTRLRTETAGIVAATILVNKSLPEQ